MTSTVRIFIAPRNDHNGKTLSLEKQRDFVFILDIFNQYRKSQNAQNEIFEIYYTLKLDTFFACIR